MVSFMVRAWPLDESLAYLLVSLFIRLYHPTPSHRCTRHGPDDTGWDKPTHKNVLSKKVFACVCGAG